MTTKIEWAQNADGSRGETWNPIRARFGGRVGWACTKVSAGCANCYSERRNLAKRCNQGTGLAYTAGNAEKVEWYVDENTRNRPYHWRKPRTVFVCSMTDFFARPWIDGFQRLWLWEVMRDCRRHTFIILTKRPDEAEHFLWTSAPPWGRYLPNVWLGVTAENRETADERIPILLRCPAAVRFVSIEPMLGPVDLSGFAPFSWEPAHPEAVKVMRDVWPGGLPPDSINAQLAQQKLDWVIVGGESGPGARPMDPDWAREVRDQCQDAGVPFFFKQWGEYAPEEHLDVPTLRRFCDRYNYGLAQCKPELIRRFSGDGTVLYPAGHGHEDGVRTVSMYRVGHKRAGRVLDGRTWEEMPERAKEGTR